MEINIERSPQAGLELYPHEKDELNFVIFLIPCHERCVCDMY